MINIVKNNKINHSNFHLIKNKTMKRTTSNITEFTLKAVFFLFCTVAFMGFINCDGQSIVGKWNQVSAKQFFNSEDAKKLGRSFVEVPTGSAGNTVIEFKSDHTYIKTLSGKYHPKPISLTGSWSGSGDQFKMKIDANQADSKYNPPKGYDPNSETVSLKDNVLTVSMPVTAANNPLGAKMIKIEATYKRM